MYREASTYGFGRRYNSWDRAWIFGVRVASPDTERLMELYISAGLFKEQNGREIDYCAKMNSFFLKSIKSILTVILNALKERESPTPTRSWAYDRLAFVIWLLIRRQTWTPFLGPGTKASKRLKRSMGDRKYCERRKKGRLIPLSKNPELR